MADEKKETKAPEPKKVAKLVLQEKHATATLTYKEVNYDLATATQEQLQVLFNAPNDIWKYLFEI